MTALNHVTINHTCKCYALHTTREHAVQAAKNCRKNGCYATAMSLADALQYGQLIGYEDVTEEAAPPSK